MWLSVSEILRRGCRWNEVYNEKVGVRLSKTQDLRNRFHQKIVPVRIRSRGEAGTLALPVSFLPSSTTLSPPRLRSTMALPVPSSPSRARPSSSDSDRRPAELEEADYFICDSEREEKAGEYSSFSLDEGESSSVGWSGAQKVERRRALRRNLSLGGLVVGAAVGGWLGGSTHAGERLLRTAGGGSLDFGTDDKLAS